jgi:hypothetical protein
MRQAVYEVLAGLQGERTAASGRPATSDRVRELVEAKFDGLHIQTCGTSFGSLADFQVDSLSCPEGLEHPARSLGILRGITIPRILRSPVCRSRQIDALSATQAQPPRRRPLSPIPDKGECYLSRLPRGR